MPEYIEHDGNGRLVRFHHSKNEKLAAAIPNMLTVEPKELPALFDTTGPEPVARMANWPLWKLDGKTLRAKTQEELDAESAAAIQAAADSAVIQAEADKQMAATLMDGDSVDARFRRALVSAVAALIGRDAEEVKSAVIAEIDKE